ncbi:hypothetical protein LCGC14_0696490 [marine sediment metagenome]|uniref:Uncharacterized protein n=1 Tax=marine sediment metagenome TaxID=412755 RepID=A0A0F9R4C9_9ZZZZ
MVDQKKLNDISLPNDPKYTDKPISVDANVTPITQQPVESIDADQWANMGPRELQNQLFALQQRYYAAMSMNQTDIAKQIQKGLNNLTLLLKRHPENTERFF